MQIQARTIADENPFVVAHFSRDPMGRCTRRRSSRLCFAEPSGAPGSSRGTGTSAGSRDADMSRRPPTASYAGARGMTTSSGSRRSCDRFAFTTCAIMPRSRLCRLPASTSFVMRKLGGFESA